jgi:hypothetical protein
MKGSTPAPKALIAPRKDAAFWFPALMFTVGDEL